MHKLIFIEKWGTGINRILISCENRRLKKPEIIEKNDFFEVKLFKPKEDSLVNNNKIIESPRSITDSYGQLTSEKKAILLYIMDNGSISRREATELVDLKKLKIHELFLELINDDLLLMEGKGINTHYVLDTKIKLELY